MAPGEVLVRQYWASCRRCNLYRTRRTVVIGEGPIPADVLLIGEGPGKTEDLVGRPFIGDAGQVLRYVLDQVDPEPSYYITNMVACRPTDAVNGKNRPPEEDELAACYPRLRSLIRLVNPRLIIALGRVPERYLKRKSLDVPVKYILHPSGLLRKGGITGPHYRGYKRTFLETFNQLTKEKN